MSVTFAVLLFLVIAVGLALLPILPAVAEWHDPVDTEPLTVVHESEVEIERFARVFRSFVEGSFGSLLEECHRKMVTEEGVLDDDTPYLVAGTENPPILREVERREGRSDRLLIGAADLRLPGRTVFARDIYARGSVYGREGSIYRAILAEESVELAAASRSLRWVHAGTWVRAATGSVLHGRVSAGVGIHLERGCTFERLHASRIEFGDPAAGVAGERVDPGSTSVLEPADVPGILDTEAGRWLVARGLEIPAGALVEADLVVTGACKLGAGAHILGSVKSHDDLVLAEDVRVEGSIVSGRHLWVGEGCQVWGPVLAEATIDLSGGCRIGTPEGPTTVSALSIHATIGALVHGTVWAHEAGHVRPARDESRSGVAA
jgi:cytoskeletal protein CcmA (bactofilin family)